MFYISFQKIYNLEKMFDTALALLFDKLYFFQSDNFIVEVEHLKASQAAGVSCQFMLYETFYAVIGYIQFISVLNSIFLFSLFGSRNFQVCYRFRLLDQANQQKQSDYEIIPNRVNEVENGRRRMELKVVKNGL